MATITRMTHIALLVVSDPSKAVYPDITILCVPHCPNTGGNAILMLPLRVDEHSVWCMIHCDTDHTNAL